ncbi:MAG: DUF4097 family beta strand repeat protein [Bacteroidia bacterium]|nr:DUF4097 family beta strand repeat protein [Bacteroidia bacterium]
MSKFDSNIISDESVRKLLQRYLLEADDQDILTQQLIDMESQFAFENEVFNIPVIPNEQQLINQLQSNLGKSFKLKWLFTSILTISALTGIAYYYLNDVSKASTRTLTPTIPTHIENKPELKYSAEIPNSETPEKSSSNNNQNKPITPLESNICNWPLLLPVIDNELPVQSQSDSRFKTWLDSPSLNKKESIYKKTIPIVVGHFAYDTLLNGITRIEVEGGFCNIVVNSSPANQTSFECSIDVSGRFRKLKGEYELNCTRIGSTLKVTLIPNENIYMTGINMTLKGQINFIVPYNTEVDVSNTTGDIEVSNIKAKNHSIDCRFGQIKADYIEGNLKINSNSGAIDVHDIKGELHIDARFGNITMSDIDGASTVNVKSGSVKISKAKGNCKIEAGFGKVSVNDLTGDLEIFSYSGNLDAFDINGNTCKIQSLFGHIDMSRIKARINIISRSGNCTLNEIEGNCIIINRFGNQNITDLKGELKLTNTSGHIHVTRHEGDLYINADFGHVYLNDCKGKMSIEIKSGNLNGSEIELVESLNIQSNFGNIKMQLMNEANTLSFDLYTPIGKATIKKEDIDVTKVNSSLILTNGSILIKSQTNSGWQFFN